MADNAKKNILTYAGLQELETELEDLKVNKRKEVAQKIKEAREQGDLSENAEYDAAKDEQRDIEARIEEIEKILKNVEVVAEDEVDDKKINVGCHIKIFDYEFDEELEFSIVGSTQTDSLNGKISNESPLGHALIGHEIGDEVEVEMGETVSKYSTADANASVKTRMRACLVSEATSRFQAGTLFTQGLSAMSDELVTVCMQKLALQSAGISQESQSTAAAIIQNLQNFGTAQ